jgi:hypothetical protein
MLPISSVPTAVVASFIVVIATVAIGTRYRLGPHADWVEVVRAVAWPIVDPVIERVVGGVGSAYQLGEREFVGHLNEDIEVVEKRLWNAGSRRNIIATYKESTDDRDEAGSWVCRDEGVPDRKQVHVMLFETDDCGTDVYAHMEYSSALRWLRDDPKVLRKHYAGRYCSPEAGAEFVHIHLLDRLQ